MHENEKLIREYIEEIWNNWNHHRIRDFVHEDYTGAGFNGKPIKGPDNLVKEIAFFKRQYDVFAIEVLDTIADGNDRMVAFVRAQAHYRCQYSQILI